ncbi:MAG: hypothetical protein ACO3JL_20640, partial [Myxococcota bacterium]
ISGWAIGDRVHVKPAADLVPTADVGTVPPTGPVPYDIVDITPNGSLVLDLGGVYNEATGDVLFDPCATVTTITAQALAGTKGLALATANLVVEGQELTVGASSGAQTCTVEAINGLNITCVEDLTETQEIGSTVYDAACGRGLRAPERELSSPTDETLIANTTITTATTELWLKTGADLGDIVAGDLLWIANGDELVSADIVKVATLQDQAAAPSTAALEPFLSDDNPAADNAEAYVKIFVTGVSGALTDIDPTETTVTVYMDTFTFTPDASLLDTSGIAIEVSTLQ